MGPRDGGCGGRGSDRGGNRYVSDGECIVDDGKSGIQEAEVKVLPTMTALEIASFYKIRKNLISVI